MFLRKAFLFFLSVTVLAFGAAGTLTVPIKEYEVPTPQSRPHDPARAPDGSLLVHRTGRQQNWTARSENWRVPGVLAENAPFRTTRFGGRPARRHLVHGISAGYVGRLDPKTGD